MRQTQNVGKTGDFSAEAQTLSPSLFCAGGALVLGSVANAPIKLSSAGA